MISGSDLDEARDGYARLAAADRPPRQGSIGMAQDRLLALLEAQRAVAASPDDLPALAAATARAAATLVQAPAAVVSRVEGDELVCLAVAGDVDIAVGDRARHAGLVSGAALATGEAIRVDEPADGGWARAALVVPLVAGGRSIGVLTVQSPVAGQFDDLDVELLTLLGGITAERAAHALAVAAAQEAVAETQRRLAAAQALAKIATFEWLPHDGHLTWSTEMYDLFGIGYDVEPTAEMHRSLVHPADYDALVQAGNRCREQHRPTELVTRICTGTGERRTVWTRMEVSVASDGTETVWGVAQDITERLRAIDEVRESRRRLEAAADLASLGTWEWHRATDELVWSSKMYELFGLPVGEPITRDRQRSMVHPDDLPAVEGVDEAALGGGDRQQLVARIVRSDGAVRHHWTRLDVTRDDDGEVQVVWGVTQDISEREEGRRALSASEQQFRVAFENAPIGMWMTGIHGEVKGKLLSANTAFLRLLGYDPDELSDLDVARLTHPDDVQRDLGHLASLVDGRHDRLDFDKRLLRKDGSVVHAWLSAAVLRDTDGRPLYLLCHAIDVTERRQQQQQLERLARTDTLTGLANRSSLELEFRARLQRQTETGAHLAMLLFDIDRFKNVNDSLGHVVGDELLVQVAQRVRSVLRDGTLVARLGGDEFVVVCEDLSGEDVERVAARIREAVRQPFALGQHGDVLAVTASVGVALAAPEEALDATEIYRRADIALYEAKDSGRDCVVVFDDRLRACSQEKLETEQILRRALAEDWLELYFQPIVNVATGKIRSAEALLRIRHPERGLLLPGPFVDVAEEIGLVAELDTRVAELAAAHIGRWHDVLREHGWVSVSINASARSLEHPSYVDRLVAALRRRHAPGSALRVEVTERTLLGGTPVVRESLARLRDLGCHVGIDDFGTGYSALSYLARMDLDFLKIDRSFVGRLGLTERDDAMVSAIVDLAHAHDLLVVAEGVETAEQLTTLRAFGVERVQGYYLGRPMPAADYEALVRSAPSW